MKKAMFTTMVALGATAFILMAQDPAKFNGTWKGTGGQVRKLNVKDGIVFMEEQNTNGLLILRQYPFQNQEVTMTEGVWKDAKATGKMVANKLVVETTMANGTQWHDEWTMAEDGKSYAALRVNVNGGGFGAAKGGAKAPPADAAKGPAGGGGGGKGKAPEPETFTKIQ